MFDVPLRNTVDGVPVPLPGRGLLFAGADGLWRTRLPDGSVVTNQGAPGTPGQPGEPGQQGVQGLPGQPGAQGVQGDTGQQGVQGTQGVQGVQGLQGLPGVVLVGYTGAATNATATAVACLSAVDFAAFVAGGGGLNFQVRGDQTNGTTASTLNVSVRTNGTVRATASIALGTAAQTNRGWIAKGSLSVFQGNALVDVALQVAGLAPVAAMPVPFAVAGAQSVDVVFALSAAVAGVSVRSHLGFALRGFVGGVV